MGLLGVEFQSFWDGISVKDHQGGKEVDPCNCLGVCFVKESTKKYK